MTERPYTAEEKAAQDKMHDLMNECRLLAPSAGLEVFGYFVETKNGRTYACGWGHWQRFYKPKRAV